MKFDHIRNALHWLWRQLLRWSLVALLLLAVWVGAGRELMPLVSDYKGRLEADLSQRAGVPVRIQSLRGGWDGLSPYFVAEGIELRDPHHPQQVLLRLPGVTTRPAILPSLLHREPRLITTLEGLSLHLRQQADGSLQVAELAQLASSDPAAARQTVSLLLRQPYFAVQDGFIELSLQGRPPLALSKLELSSLNAGRHHWLKGRFHLPGNSLPVQLVMRFQGAPMDWPHGGDMQAYFNTPALDLDAWLQGLAIPELAVQSARAGGEYWLDFRQGSLQSIVGRVSVPEAKLLAQVGKRSSNYEARNLHGLLSLQREGQGWTFSANGLSGSINNLPLPAPRFALQVQDRELQLSTAQLALGPLRQLAQNAAVLPPALQGWLQATAVTGWVPHLRATVRRGDDGQLGLPSVQAEFKALSLNSYGALPGIGNIAGWLSLGPDGGLLYLDSRNSRLDLHQFFHEPLLADSLSGGIRVLHGDKVWSLQSGPLQVSNSDASGSAVLSVDVPEKDPGATQLHLVAGLHDGKASAAWRYTPWAAAGDDTVAWLRQALTGGTLSSATFLFDGPVGTRKDLPESQLQMSFHVHDGSLAYLPGWPAVTGMDAEVVIDNSRLSVSSKAARVYDTVADNVSAQIPDLSHPLLSVSASLEGPAGDALRLFRESPLKDELAAVGNSLSAEGDVIGQLDLQVPLADNRPVKVKVEADLPGNTLKLPQQQLQVEQLQGHLSYSTDQGLVSKHLEGRLFDDHIEGHVGSQVHGGDLSLVRIGVDGRVAVPKVLNWVGGGLSHYVEGETDYQADISLPTDSRPTQLTVTSKLDGVRIKLPAPLGKGDEPEALRYQTELGDGKTSARLQLGRDIGIGMNQQDGHLQGLLLRIGDGGNATLPTVPGLSVAINQTPLDVAAWQHWMDSNSSAAGDSQLPPLTDLVLDSGELIAGGYELRKAHVEAAHQDGGWAVTVSSDRLSGHVTLPAKGGITAELSRLQWPLSKPRASVAESSSPAGMPAALTGVPISLSVNDLELDDWPDLHSSKLTTQVLASEYGLTASQIVLSNSPSSASFQGTVNWQWQGAGHTRIDGLVQGGDIGTLLADLDFTPKLNSERHRTELHLNWTGGPGDFSIEGLNGRFEAQACRGHLLNVGLVTSASRIFGLFDPDNIKRRLHLDFNDVTKKGVLFDEAEAGAELRGGVLQPAHFALKGPSMSADGHGKIDLNASSVDQDIDVRLPVVAGALPAAIAFAANPLLGAAVVVGFDSLWNKELDKLTVLHYHVSGGWDDPQVQRSTLTAAEKAKLKADKAKAAAADKDKDKGAEKELAPFCSEKVPT